MKSALESADIEQFRIAIARCYGLSFDESRIGFLQDVLRRRAAAHDANPAEYLTYLESSEAGPDERRALALELTVGETYFFRNPDQFRALCAAAVPTCLRLHTRNQPLRILSAGCASGEEAYSIAILLRTMTPALETDRIVIHGVDINTGSLEKARRGRYSSWSLRETAADVRERWFRAEGKEFALDEMVRSSVHFRESNIVTEPVATNDVYDIIFCRNVIMYFTPDQARSVVARLARQLAPAGFLFLGHAETLRGLSHDFHLRHTHNTFYYQRKAVLGADGSPDDFFATPDIRLAAPPVLDAGDAWVENIRRASERINRLSDERRAAPAVAPRTAVQPHPPWDLRSVMDLFRQERFSEALALLQRLPAESEGDPDVLLLLTLLHIHNGELDAAEKVCRVLIDGDGMNAGAHYLMALCCEAAGDLHTAASHDQMAVYLDSTFAMPRLHLGLLARKEGRHSAARREFSQAAVLLQSEDVSRLVFFGGGFNRDALLAICTSEIAACGDERR